MGYGWFWLVPTVSDDKGNVFVGMLLPPMIEDATSEERLATGNVALREEIKQGIRC